MGRVSSCFSASSSRLDLSYQILDYLSKDAEPRSALAKWFCLSSSSSSRYSRGLQPHVPQMDSRDRTGFYLMMLLLRSFGRARSSLVFYVWLALLDLEELVGLKGCFPTRPEDSVEMSTAKGTSSGSIEEGGAQASSNDKGCQYRPKQFRLGEGAYLLPKLVRRKEFEGCRPGIVVQFVREPPCQGGSCGFKSRQSRPMIRERYINSSLRGEKERLDLISQPSFVSHFSSDKESQGMVKSNIPVLSQSLLPGRCNQYTNTVLSTATVRSGANSRIQLATHFPSSVNVGVEFSGGCAIVEAFFPEEIRESSILMTSDVVSSGVSRSEWQVVEQMGSDHSLILLNTEVLDSMKCPFFPYDSQWDKDEECAEVVKQAWQLNVRGSDLFKVQQKMTNCWVELLKWRS
ncbi:hypothetical protein GOBAR_AA07245 [Gossypium barbadense]|uniref:Uncharacterized protein n=1 Tax=Gossypium barbadense TaxID=3634 RepID=A0A2P5YCK6_GOSBA|nr:hypothetical protein GOBAR_AA07245 [Gossypium barbadense]